MPHVENRVRVRDYGVLPSDSPLLVPVASPPGVVSRLHVVAAEAFADLARAALVTVGVEMRVVSGWRAHRWASRDAYEAVLIERYGSVAEGGKWLAFNSPHETGLAMDLQCGGLRPNSATAKQQRDTDLHRWMVARACEFGWTPYLPEPWHWEFNIPRETWLTGKANAEATT